MVASPPSAIVVIGPERYLKDRAVEEITAAVLGSTAAAREFDLKICYGAETTAETIVQHASTYPLLSPQRLILIRDAERIAKEEWPRLISYLLRPSPSSCIVFDARTDSILKELEPVRQRLSVRRIDEVTEAHVAALLRKAAAARGKKFEERALILLAELIGRDLSGAAQEVEKLATYAASRETITVADVEELVGKSAVASAFDLVTFISRKDVTGALSLVRELLLAGKKPHEIVGIVAWHLKGLLRAIVLRGRGMNEYAVAREVGVKQDRREDFFAEVRTVGIARAGSYLASLLEADLDMKRSRSDPKAVLETVIVRLCLEEV